MIRLIRFLFILYEILSILISKQRIFMKIKIHNTRRSNSSNNWSIFINHSIEILFFIIRRLLILLLFYKIIVMKLELLGIHTYTHDLSFHFIKAIYLLVFYVIRTTSRRAISRTSCLTLALLFLILLVLILIILAQITARWNIAAWG
jgi:hypothetical protein